MKKILILAHDYAPFNSVGAIRPTYWAENFYKENIHVTVITKNWKSIKSISHPYLSETISKKVEVEIKQNYTIHWCPTKASFSQKLLEKYGNNRLKFLRKISTLIKEFLQYFLPIGTKKFIQDEANIFLKTNKIDVIIATGDPFVLFHYASKLSDKFGIPWIADYRDPWSSNLKKGINLLYYFNRSIEKKTVKSAWAIISVSDYCLNRIQQTAKCKNELLISNGYNEELFCDFIQSKDSKKFIITHGGSIYHFHSTEPFVKGVIKFAQKFPDFDFQINMIGTTNYSSFFNNLKLHPEILKKFTFIKSISNKEIAQIYKDSNLLLLFNNFELIGTKIFDYLAVKRKILFCFDNAKHAKTIQSFSLSPQKEVIINQNAGIIAKDENDLIIQLEILKNEFEKTGTISCNSKDSSPYSRKIQLEKLANYIHENF